MAEQRSDTQWATGSRTDITWMSRVGEAVRGAIRGASEAWFGPWQPLQPFAQDQPGVKGRRFDYPTGYNLSQVPRAYEPTSFADLRYLSRANDVLRGVIETRKDQMCALNYQIRVRVPPGQAVNPKSVTATPDQKNRIKTITEFMQYPDKEMDFEQWTRAFLEDHFVIDAPTVYRRPTKGGEIYALELIDGATIMPKLDGTGRRPLPPDVAYQQVLHGVPAADYSADELYYCVHNPSTNHVYGHSRVEQVLLTANIAIRRALFQLEYYTKGNQPDAFIGLPESWDITAVKTFQDWLDNLRTQRRLLRAVPGKFQYQATKEANLKDEYDDYLNRVICFVFSVPPNSLVKMMNRAQSESQHDQALEEGLFPTMKWYKSFWNRVIINDFKSPDLEFDYIDDREVDPKEQADIDVEYVKAGIYTIDEVREKRGADPLGGAAALPMVQTTTGYMTIGANVPEEDGGDMPEEEEHPPGTLIGPDGQPIPPAKPEAAGEAPGRTATPLAAEKLAKKAHKGQRRPASAKHTTLRGAHRSLKKKIAPLLKAMGKHVATQLSGKFGKLSKAEGDEDIDLALDELDLAGFHIIAASTTEEANRVAAESGRVALSRVGVTVTDELVNQVNERAADYAQERAAWLVGKTIDANGAIVDNPKAEYAIDQETRDRLRATISGVLESGTTKDELASEIEKSFAFSEARAEMIAGTEIGNANSAGALEGYRVAAAIGVANKKAWVVSGNDSCCDECQANEDEGPIDLDDIFQSGDDAPLAHPNCACVLVSVVEEQGDEE